MTDAIKDMGTSIVGQPETSDSDKKTDVKKTEEQQIIQQPGPADDGVEIWDQKEWDARIASLPDELKGQAKALQKSLQGDYTKKTQQLALLRKNFEGHQHKIAAYDNFYANPESNLAQLAAQLGFTVTKTGTILSNSGDDKNDDAVAIQVQKEIKPLVEEMRKKQVMDYIKNLDDNFPDWRMYEEEFVKIVNLAPALIKFPEKIYELAVPPEKKEAIAYQRYLKKQEGKRDTALATAGSSKKSTKVELDKDGIKSFEDAITYARKTLGEKGIKSPI